MNPHKDEAGKPSDLDTIPQSCPLLELPAELRLMIYNYLPTTTRHSSILNLHNHEDSTIPNEGTIKLVLKSVPAALLATCKLIHSEAHPIFGPKISALRNDHPRIIVHPRAFSNRTLLTGILNTISIWMATILDNGKDLPFSSQEKALQATMKEWSYIKPSDLQPPEHKDVFTYIQKSSHQLANLSSPSLNLRRDNQYLEIIVTGFETHARIHKLTHDLGYRVRLLRYGIRVMELGERQAQPLLFTATPARVVGMDFAQYSDFWRQPMPEDEELGDYHVDTKFVKTEVGNEKRYFTARKEYRGMIDREEYEASWAERVEYM